MNNSQDQAFFNQVGCSYLAPDFDPRTWNYVKNPLTPYCGCRPVRPGTSYCETHAEQMGQRKTRVRTRHADIRRANAHWDLASEFNEAVAELVAEGELEL